MGIQEERCPNCARLEARIAELEAELRAIKALLGLDSTTSNQPPSKDLVIPQIRCELTYTPRHRPEAYSFPPTRPATLAGHRFFGSYVLPTFPMPK